MARIRTIKPEFFLHEGLFDLEESTGLPIRVAFPGLWCQADREGRFKWRPRSLGAQCLPFDDVDFSRVLHALATRGFVRCYACQGGLYGVISGFTEHQVVNNREKASQLPDPDGSDCVTIDPDEISARVDDACPTRAPRDTENAKRKGKERKGREGKGRERKRHVDDATDSLFEEFWNAYPNGRKRSRGDALPAWRKALKSADAELIISKAAEYAASDEGQGEFVQMPSSWLNQQRWKDHPDAWNSKKQARLEI